MNKKSKMVFLVDKVTEDSFYENLLLGLPRILDKLPIVQGYKLQRNSPATKVEVKHWENTYRLSLPQDLRDLYLSCNGILLTYVFFYEPTNREENACNEIHAKIEVNPINALNLIVEGYEVKNIPRIYHDGYIYKLELSSESRIFELSKHDTYRVVLVYADPKSSPTIWIWFGTMFYFIANDLTTYLKMAIAHLGVPYWQFIFTPMGLPGRSREMLNVLAPGILHEDYSMIPITDNTNDFNKIYPDIFNKIMVESTESKKSCAEQLMKKTSNSSTASRKSHIATITKKSSCLTVGRKTSSVVSSNSEKVKRGSFTRRRILTPKI
ncbi:hypothetical protein WA026_016316 [Henosepilachna vigintioctopunctata]|uniref:Knr4/Smi1-like domain-containing protein n=1 Tax=Henosepilachna vigintioctopunctata TaxID=420089 RepID=A0AAW1UK05_9CUCU